LEVAERHFDAIDAKRRGIEAEINEGNLRAQEGNIALRAAESPIVVVEAKLHAGGKRAAAADTRAEGAIAALAQVEDAIRKYLIDVDQSSTNRLALEA
jgi:hypothetical protein